VAAARLKFIVSLLLLMAMPGYAHVYCEYPDDCPPAINQLQYKNKRCTAFLVARDLIATNLHCLPDEMNKERQSCEGIDFVFPKSKNHEPETLKCKTIEFLSEPLEKNSVNVDLAILRTHSNTNREALNFSQDGFQDEKDYAIYKIDPNSDTGGGVVVKSTCQAIQNAVINPYFSSDKSPIVNFIPCRVIPGNSGSPIMSSNNEVRGIIHSSSDGKLSDLFADQHRKMDKKIYSAFGTSFACVHLDLFSYPRYNHSACHIKINKDSARQLEKKKNDEISDQINKKVREEFNKFTEKLKTLKNDKMYLLQWKFGPWDSKLESKNFFVYMPACYNAKVYKASNTHILNLDLLEIEMNSQIDDRFRYRYKMKSNIHRNKVFLELKRDQQLRVDLNYAFGTKTMEVSPCRE
jgi:V8-like Glu-specific endopeptidase